MGIFFRLAWFFKLKWRHYAVAGVTLWVVALLVMVPPWLTGRLVDAIANKTITSSFLVSQLLVIAGVGVLIYVLRIVWRASLYGASYQLSALLRERLFLKLTQMTPAFYQTHRTGDLMARATNDVSAVEMTAGEGVLSLVDGLMTGAIVLAVMMIRAVLPSWLTGFTDWATIVVPVAGVFVAFGLCERVTPHYLPAAPAAVFVLFGLLSLGLALSQHFPQPALQGVIWSLAFLGASAFFFVMPAVEMHRARSKITRA